MKNFYRVAEGVDVTPLLYALHTNADLWDAHPIRTQHPGTVHSQVSDILLRFQPIEQGAGIPDAHESVCFPGWWRLPQAQDLVYALVARVRGTRLGRVIITRLPPGKSIDAHVDGGAHAEYYERHHIVLQNGKGSNFRAGDENVCMKAGEVWWFDNSAEHEVTNHSDVDRITMIVDIRVEKPC